jgi:urocanate hydratase
VLDKANETLSIVINGVAIVTADCSDYIIDTRHGNLYINARARRPG